jgi:hypothetical protein
MSLPNVALAAGQQRLRNMVSHANSTPEQTDTQPAHGSRRALRCASCIVVLALLFLLICGIAGSAVVMGRTSIVLWAGTSQVRIEAPIKTRVANRLPPHGEFEIGPNPWENAPGGYSCERGHPMLSTGLFEMTPWQCRPQ